MKRMAILLVLAAIIAFLGITGCATSPDSSSEEADYVVRHLPDFQSIGVVKQLTAVKLGFLGRIMTDTDESKIIIITHIATYKTKSGHQKLVLLNGLDIRPPKVVYEKLLD